MTGAELEELAEGLEQYLGLFDRWFRRSESRGHLRVFARGQLGSLERKSLEPIADAEGVKPRALQQFFSEYQWNENGARDQLQKMIAAEHGGEEGIFIVDETSDAKKGTWTAGVGRQYCGESGKVDNCIVTVHLAYARGDFHALLDGELFLPESWDPTPGDAVVTARRRRAEIPDEVRHESKAALALRQLRRAKANGVPGRWVSADEGYGAKPWWRSAVRALGYGYVVEVPKSTQGWTREPQMEVGAYAGQGRPRKARPATAALRVEKLGRAPEGWRFQKWQPFRIHDTEKGPEVWEFKAGPFWEHSRQEPRVPQTLLIGRNVRTGELKYFLAHAPAGTPLRTLVKVAFSRWHIERCFQDCKTELGLNHAELRSYRGLHRHLILTAINYYFLQDRLGRRGGKKEDGGNSKPVRGCASGLAAAQIRRHTHSPTTAPLGDPLGRQNQPDAGAKPACQTFPSPTAPARTAATRNPLLAFAVC